MSVENYHTVKSEDFNSFVEDFYFIPSIQNFLEDLIKNKPFKCYVAGGLFKDIFSNRGFGAIKDIDFFFETLEDFNKALNYFTKENTNDLYEVIYENNNCIGIKGKKYRIELIRKNFDNIINILDNFDFTITKCAFYLDEKNNSVFTFHKDFFNDLKNKEIKYSSNHKTKLNLNVFETIERILRYQGYGFKVTEETNIKTIKFVKEFKEFSTFNNDMVPNGFIEDFEKALVKPYKHRESQYKPSFSNNKLDKREIYLTLKSLIDKDFIKNRKTFGIELMGIISSYRDYFTDFNSSKIILLNNLIDSIFYTKTFNFNINYDKYEDYLFYSILKNNKNLINLDTLIPLLSVIYWNILSSSNLKTIDIIDLGIKKFGFTKFLYFISKYCYEYNSQFFPKENDWYNLIESEQKISLDININISIMLKMENYDGFNSYKDYSEDHNLYVKRRLENFRSASTPSKSLSFEDLEIPF